MSLMSCMCMRAVMIKRLLESLNILANPPANKCRDIPWLTEHMIHASALASFLQHFNLYLFCLPVGLLCKSEEVCTYFRR